MYRLTQDHLSTPNGVFKKGDEISCDGMSPTLIDQLVKNGAILPIRTSAQVVPPPVTKTPGIFPGEGEE